MPCHVRRRPRQAGPRRRARRGSPPRSAGGCYTRRRQRLPEVPRAERSHPARRRRPAHPRRGGAEQRDRVRHRLRRPAPSAPCRSSGSSAVIAVLVFVVGLAAAWFAQAAVAGTRRKLEAELQSTYERLREAEALRGAAGAGRRGGEPGGGRDRRGGACGRRGGRGGHGRRRRGRDRRRRRGPETVVVDETAAVVAEEPETAVTAAEESAGGAGGDDGRHHDGRGPRGRRRPRRRTPADGDDAAAGEPDGDERGSSGS